MIAGFAVHQNSLVTWGEGILWRRLPDGEELARAGEGRVFGAGGAVFDGGLVVNELQPRPALAWYRKGARVVIEDGVDAADIAAAELHGRRGVILIHKRAQLRFYELPSGAARDLYSIYTPAWQGGLLTADVDGDGRIDILCGNYWLRSPPAWDLPWRLFAINTWTETEQSGMMRLAWRDGALYAVQREMSPARLAVFSSPADPTQLWDERRIGVKLDRPQSIDLWDGGIVVTDGRLMLIRDGRSRVLRGAGVRFAQAVGSDLLLLAPDGAIWWYRRP